MYLTRKGKIIIFGKTDNKGTIPGTRGKKKRKKILSEDVLKQTTRIWGCLSFSLTLQNFWKAHLSIRRRVLAAAQGAWWVSPSPGAATPH